MADLSIAEQVCLTLDDEYQAKICFQEAVRYFQISTGGKTAGEAGSCDKVTVYNSMCYEDGGHS